MTQSPIMALEDTHAAENRTIAPLILIGLVLLAVGVLVAGWEPIELPLGLIALGTMALALLTPSLWQDDEARDTVNSLVLASLITLAGFHVMA